MISKTFRNNLNKEKSKYKMLLTKSGLKIKITSMLYVHTGQSSVVLISQ